jgi:hypothetical protein
MVAACCIVNDQRSAVIVFFIKILPDLALIVLLHIVFLWNFQQGHFAIEH